VENEIRVCGRQVGASGLDGRASVSVRSYAVRQITRLGFMPSASAGTITVCTRWHSLRVLQVLLLGGGTPAFRDTEDQGTPVLCTGRKTCLVKHSSVMAERETCTQNTINPLKTKLV
jgi:hypothetical protein